LVVWHWSQMVFLVYNVISFITGADMACVQGTTAGFRPTAPDI
jgi:hypothetical protein